MMKRIVIAISAVLAMASCSAPVQQAGMTENDAKVKIDSLVGIRLGDLMTQSSEDLDRRISIEVKPKADSIYNAWKQANP
ncbi:MAG: hypothetical protein JNL72_07480 [Flavipsychrobacter sp.]|nr:hypothetical protein [Flavipsychrobacter sp.]